MVLTYITLAVWLVCHACAALRWVHMLQLNSYRASTQLRWMKTHPQKLLCLFFQFFKRLILFALCDPLPCPLRNLI